MLAACLLSGCSPEHKVDPRQLDEKQAKELAELGTKNFGIGWKGPVVGAGEHGVKAVTDGVTTLTTHAGSRVFIVHNRKEFPPRDQDAFKGSDEELKNIGLKFLKASGAKEDEIGNMQILQHFTQVGEKIANSNELRVEAPKNSVRTLFISRRVGGIDAVSSRLLLNVNGTGNIAFMELSWPDFDRDVLERVGRLQKMVESRYSAPQMEGAEVEAVQPVLLHSPAVGFYNDTTAAIRVIYRPNTKQVGQKPVRYIDERGVDITLPRDVDRPHEAPLKRLERNRGDQK
jgi:hypothetical protein